MITRRILTVMLVVLSAACAPIGKQVLPAVDAAAVGDEVVEFRGCMEFVRDTNTTDPMMTAVTQKLANLVFSCEYFRGQPITIYGRTASVGGRPIIAGYGYVIADHASSIDHGEVLKNVFDVHEKSHRDVMISVEGRESSVLGHYTVPLYLIHVKHRYLGERTVGALAMMKFSVRRQPYTLFLWVQGGRLSEEAITDRFRRLIPLVMTPNEQMAMQ